MKNQEEKFWLRVKKSTNPYGCWEWMGPVDIRGYGNFCRKKAHRIAWELINGSIPSGMDLLRRCGRTCVNPAHMRLGRRGDNAKEQFATGVEERFWRKVDKSGDCWLWTGCLSRDGYGHFRSRVNDKSIVTRAHCFSWTLHNGSTVPKGMEVCHRCNVPACVNPSHLYIDTHYGNIHYCWKSGRNKTKKGEESPNSILTNDIIKIIRESFLNGDNVKVIAKNIGVHWSTVYRVLNGKTWSHVK